MSQADYYRQQGLNPKAFSKWARCEYPVDPNAPLEVTPFQVPLYYQQPKRQWCKN